MKKQLLAFGLVALLAGFIGCKNQTETSEEDHSENTFVEKSSPYDSIKAAKAGADDYGMRPYVMAFLKRGPNRDLPKTQADSLQMAHMANIGRMAEEGKLILAGPFMGDGDLRGIYIFKVETVEEAEALTLTDPAIQAGSLVMELQPWYGSAALVELNELHYHYVKKSEMEL